MINKIYDIEDYKKIIDELPIEVVNDINNRIMDWLCSGGTLEDSYVQRQFHYAYKVFKNIKTRGVLDA